jgi:putative transcriptional regulator
MGAKPYDVRGEMEKQSMIQCRLRELMAAKTRRDRRKVTYMSISESTGIATSTLWRLANDKTDRVVFQTMDLLCTYFDCSPCDLFVHINESNP